MDRSPNIETENVSRKERVRVARVRAVLSGLVQKHTSTLFPAMSEHFQRPVDNSIPGVIGSVLLPHQYDDAEHVYHPSPHMIDDGRTGYDSDGNYHMLHTEPVLKTELNRWNDPAYVADL